MLTLVMIVSFGLMSSTTYPDGKQSDIHKNIREITYDINIVEPAMSLSRSSISDVTELTDLDRFYDPAWVREYKKVEITAIVGGEMVIARSRSHMLSKEQIELISKADYGTELNAEVWYIPENSLPMIEVKKHYFSFSVRPEHNAEYKGGHSAMINYLEQKGISDINTNNFGEYALSIILFTVASTGEVMDVEIFNSCGEPAVDNQLHKMICDMPNWKPAHYSNGLQVDQDYALTFGNIKNCTIHTLNIDKFKLN